MTFAKWLILPAAVAVAAYAGFMVQTEAYVKALGAVVLSLALIGASILQMNRYGAGLTLLIASAVAFPIEIGFANQDRAPLNAAFPLAVFVCVCWLLRLLLLHRRPASSRFPSSARACLLFAAAAIASFASGQVRWFSSDGAPLRAQLGALGVFLVSCAIFLSAAWELKDVADVRRLTRVFVVAGSIACVTQSLPGLGIVGWWTAPHSIGSVFWTWFVAVTSSQALINTKLSPRSRILLFGLCALALYRCAFVGHDWMSGWLPSLIAFQVVLLFRFPRVTTGLSLLGLPIGLYLSGVVTQALMLSEQYSLTTRLEAWRILGQMALRSPLLGLGPANYYYYTSLFPIMGWYVRFNSHNQYLDLVLQTGIVGLGAFLWFAVEMFRLTLRLRREASDVFVKAYCAGVLGGIAGTLASGMLADWILPFIYNIGIGGFRSSLLFWVFLGGTLALKRIESSRTAADPGSHAEPAPGSASNRRLRGQAA
jgi:O-antigen ligase